MILSLVLALTAQSAVATSSDINKDPNERVCKIEYPLGTRIPERVCKTRAVWDQLAKQTREDLRTAQKNASDPH